MENHYGFIALLAYLWVTLVFSKFLDREDEAVRGLRGEDEQQKAMLFVTISWIVQRAWLASDGWCPLRLPLLWP